ncbi:hypothetical protein DFH28DRAFT_415396 [Melampsora americana]|nr:hypothetical protein DFH28DRAFT_415396 [Melampsora americana]
MVKYLTLSLAMKIALFSIMIGCPVSSQFTQRYRVIGGDGLAYFSETPVINLAHGRFLDVESSFQQLSESYLDISRQVLLPSAKSSADRLERLQTFGPLDPDFQFRPEVELPVVHPMMIWKTITSLREVGGFKIYADMARKHLQKDLHSKLALLAAGVVSIDNYCRHIQSIGFTTITRYPQSLNIASLFCENSLYQQTMEFAIEVLEQGSLKLNERIWALGILRTLQAHLPKGKLRPLRTNVQEGFVCRGALELWLTKEMNLSIEAKQSWSTVAYDGAHNPLLAQALQRAELFVELQEYLGSTTKSDITREFISIYDALLKESCLIPENKLSKLIERCENHMVQENSPEGEVICTFHIINHLEKHNESVKPKSQSAKVIYKEFKKYFEHQEKLEPLIRKFLKEGAGDPYMENLVLPFIRVKWKKLTVKYYEYVLKSLKGFEYDLAHMDHETRQKYPSMDDYQKSKIAVMEILEKASYGIEGARNVLNIDIPVAGSTEVEKQNEEELKSCIICWKDFFNGQKVVYAGCHHEHQFHHHCMENWVDSVTKNPYITPTCPLCRKVIQKPIPRSCHSFWHYPDISQHIDQQ